MGFLDKFFGPPTRDKYAAMFMAALRKAGDTRSPTYDAKEFRLVHGESGYTNLGNFYADFCSVPKADRQKCLQGQVRGSLSHLKEIPDEFDDAKCDLRPKIWTRSTMESLRLRQRLEGNDGPDIPTQAVGEHLEVSLVYDLPEAVMSIPRGQLDDWGVTFYEAMEIARHNLENSDFAFASVGESLYASLTGDTYDASRMLNVDLVRKLNVTGEHIAMVPNRDTLLIAGSDDEVGLKMMLDIAEKTLEQPRPMIATPLRLAADEWVEWFPEAEHPLFQRFNSLALKWFYQEYGDQKKMLDAIHEKEGIDLFVASYSAVEKNTGELVSYCVWTNGAGALLPKTQNVVFIRGENDIPALGQWNRVIEVVGDMMQQTEDYPPRFLVREFPSDEQLAAIGKGRCEERLPRLD